MSTLTIQPDATAAREFPASAADARAARPREPLPVATARKLDPIKLVAVDLDGTLLDSNKQVSGRTVRALKHLPEIGVQLVIASARPPRSVRHIYQALGLDNWQINYNGALIWDEGRRQAVYHRPMPGPLALAMIRAARGVAPGVVVSCEILDRWYTDREDDGRYTTETGKLFKPDVVAPAEFICDRPVTKLMFLGDPDALGPVATAIREGFSGGTTVLHAEADLIQITDRRVGKGYALAKVAGHHGVRRGEVLAIGDAPNDVGMLKWAGIGVAMDNAFDVTKKVADWIAPSNDDHGVLAALQRYGLVE